MRRICTITVKPSHGLLPGMLLGEGTLLRAAGEEAAAACLWPLLVSRQGEKDSGVRRLLPLEDSWALTFHR